MRAVEGINEPAIPQRRPAARLYRSRHFQRQCVEPHFPRLGVEPFLAREPPEVAVRTDVVEAVIVNTGVRQMSGHPLEGPRSAKSEERGVSRRIELQERSAELKALGPLRPAART